MKTVKACVVRKAIPTQDARGILEVHRMAIHSTAAPFYAEEIIREWGALPITDAMIERFQSDKDKGEIIHVAEDNGRIVGFTEVVPSNQELRAVYVDPKYGRMGLGALLLQKSEEAARDAGCERLELRSSLNAKDFYERKSATGTVSMLGFLAFIAITIACLGLLGMVIYTTETKVKEVSIRKVMGASVKNILTLLSAGYMKLVLIY